MALVVFRKCRRVTDPCLFPPYPIAQLLFAMVTMMLLMLTPYDCARHPVPRRATGRTDVTVHAVIVPSRSTGPSALRRKCATQRECRVQYDAPAGAGQRPALRLLRACGSLWRAAIRGVAHTANAIWPCAFGMASGFISTRWPGGSTDGEKRGGQPGRHVGTFPFASKADSTVARLRREVVPERKSAMRARSRDAIPVLSEFVGDPRRD